MMQMKITIKSFIILMALFLCGCERSAPGPETAADFLASSAVSGEPPAVEIEIDPEDSAAADVPLEAEPVFIPKEQDYILPESNSVVLNHALLHGLTKEDLRLARNEIYARYGYIFQDNRLQEYFESKSWYQAAIKGEAFSDQLLSNVERYNISFLFNAEKNPDNPDSINILSTPLAPSPALEKVNELLAAGQGQLSVNLIEETAVDMGVFIRVRALLGIPAVIPKDQLNRLKAGESFDLCLNQLTSQTISIRLKKPDADGFEFLSRENPDFYGYGYERENGDVLVFVNSDDLLYCDVDECELDILKGATMGHGLGMEEMSASANQGYRSIEEITIPKLSPENGESPLLFFNYTSFNQKGYITGLYYFGD